MNVHSLSLYIKSIVAANPQAIYFCFLVNLFRDLNEKDYRYYTISHSVTLYFLKVLERKGFVNLIESTKSCDTGENNMPLYYKPINNKAIPKRRVPIYIIGFTKSKNLRHSDIEFLKKLERILHIPPQFISYREKNGKLTAYINYSFIIKDRLSSTKKISSKRFTLRK